VAPGVVDARRCLAWLAQAPGDFPEEHRAALGDRLYGCDDSQEVCPVNRRHADEQPAPDGATAWVPVVELLGLDDAELLRRHGRWYVHDRDPRWLRRNALVVLGNIGSAADGTVASTIERYRRSVDDMLRRHAEWAAARLGLGQA
jgi:epoxyqueuosine reductase